MILQRTGVMLAAELRVGIHEGPGRIRCSEPFEVHGQESDVVQHVSAAKACVEFQAVQNTWTVVEHEDVVSLQVAVPVTYEPVSLPEAQQRLSPGQVPPGQLFDGIDSGWVHDRRRVLAQHGQVVTPQAAYRVRIRG